MGQITKQIKGKIVFKHETEADWNLSNYKPDNGEQVLYDPDDNCSYTRVKYGDGVNIVKDLTFGGATFDSDVSIDGGSLTVGDTITANRMVLSEDDYQYGTFGPDGIQLQTDFGSDIELRSSYDIKLHASSQVVANNFTVEDDTTLNNLIVSGNTNMGTNNSLGRYGYYYSHIDLANKKIYLTTTQPSLPVIGAGELDEDFETPGYELGKTDDNGEVIPVYFSIVNSAKWENFVEIESIQNNVLTYKGELPFDTIVDATEGGEYELEADDYSISVVDQPMVDGCSLKKNQFAVGSGNIVAGNDALGFGRRCNAYGDYSLTVGRQNRAGHASAAFGVNNDARADYVFVTGGDNIVDHRGDKSIVGGDNNYVNGNSNLVVGEDNSPIDDNTGTERDAGITGNKNLVGGALNKVTKDENIVGGQKNKVTSDRNIVGGTDNEVSEQRNIVGGQANKVSNSFNIVGGKLNTVTANGSVVGGQNNTVEDTNNIVGGNNNTTTSARNIIGGQQNNVTAKHNIVSGEQNNVSAINSIVFGKARNVSGSENIVGGFGNDTTNNVAGQGNIVNGEDHKVNANKTVVSGGKNNVTADLNAVFGDGQVVSGVANIVGGRSNKVTSRSNLIVGRSHEVLGTNTDGSGENIVGGYNHTVNGSKNIVIGESNTANCVNGILAGFYNVGTNQSLIVGNNNIGKTPNSIICGIYANQSDNALFTVGNGTSSKKDNAFEVLGNNTATIGGKRVATEDYVSARISAIPHGYVFTNLTEMIDSLQVDTGNENAYIVTHTDWVSKLVTGDNIYIIDVNTPDYWVDKSTTVTYLRPLESKIDLSSYVTKTELNNKGYLTENLLSGLGYTKKGICLTNSDNKNVGSAAKNLIVGDGNTVANDLHIVGGDNQKVYQVANIVAGRRNTVYGRGNAVFGIGNTVYVPAATQPTNSGSDGTGGNIVGGYSNTIKGVNNLVIGNNNVVNPEGNNGLRGAIVGGVYCTNRNNVLLLLGQGTSSKREDVFYVDIEGATYTAKSISIGGKVITAEIAEKLIALANSIESIN